MDRTFSYSFGQWLREIHIRACWVVRRQWVPAAFWALLIFGVALLSAPVLRILDQTEPGLFLSLRDLTNLLFAVPILYLMGLVRGAYQAASDREQRLAEESAQNAEERLTKMRAEVVKLASISFQITIGRSGDGTTTYRDCPTQADLVDYAMRIYECKEVVPEASGILREIGGLTTEDARFQFVQRWRPILKASAEIE